MKTENLEVDCCHLPVHTYPLKKLYNDLDNVIWCYYFHSITGRDWPLKLVLFNFRLLKGLKVTTSQGFAQIKVEYLCKANIRDKIEIEILVHFSFLQPPHSIPFTDSANAICYIFSPLYVNYVNSGEECLNKKIFTNRPDLTEALLFALLSTKCTQNFQSSYKDFQLILPSYILRAEYI